jgi:penicillin-binding protein 2
MAYVHEDQTRFKTFSRRALLLAGAKSALLASLIGRMYYLQVVEGERYRTLAEDNRINLRLLAPPRGRIVDRFGTAVADNRANFRVVVVPEQTPDLARILDDLARIIPVDEADRERILREVRRRRPFVPVTVRDNLSWHQVSRVEVNAPGLPGVAIEMGETRHYPFGEPMTQILGYVAAVAEHELSGDPLLELPGFRIGKTGVERQFDDQLRGSAGTSQVEVNAVGRVIRELSRDEGDPGRELVLSIDAGLQNFVHQRLLGERSAAAVVMNVHDGEVLALSSAPSYDASAFNIGLSSRQWQALVNDPLGPLNNKAIAGTYAPGSTFKMIVALAALEAGIDVDERVYCPGFMKLGRARFHCWKRQGHGWMDMHDGIKQSCDVYFYEIARRTGIDRISEMATRLGLGAATGIELPGERAGVIPTRDWKLATIGERWQGGETLVTAIGQGFVLATPLQLAVMTARLANGGYGVTPTLVRGFRDALTGDAETPAREEATAAHAAEVAASRFAPLGLSETHLAVIAEAMDAVTNEQHGTAYRSRIEEESWAMAGKTGTSQVRRISLSERQGGVKKNEDLEWRYRDHGLFVGYAPVHRPRYCCAVVVEHGGSGSRSAAPIVRDILTETQRRDPSAGGLQPVAAGPAHASASES